MAADTNPKKQYGIRKPSMDCVPSSAILHLTMAMMEGRKKYGLYNWVKDPVDVSTYYSAAMRHWMLFNSGEDKDPKTGVHHLAYAMACAAIILDAQTLGNLVDDRVRGSNLGKLMDELSATLTEPPPALPSDNLVSDAHKATIPVSSTGKGLMGQAGDGWK